MPERMMHFDGEIELQDPLLAHQKYSTDLRPHLHVFPFEVSLSVKRDIIRFTSYFTIQEVIPLEEKGF